MPSATRENENEIVRIQSGLVLSSSLRSKNRTRGDEEEKGSAPSVVLLTSSPVKSVRRARSPFPFKLHRRMYDSVKPVAMMVESSENETVERLCCAGGG